MANIGTFEWTVVLIGLGTVFLALFVLAGILKGFAIISRKLGDSKAAESTPAAAPEAPPAGPVPEGVSPEIAAAIAAAIAAFSGRRVSDVRISRIAPSPAAAQGLNTPVWSYADRLASGRR